MTDASPDLLASTWAHPPTRDELIAVGRDARRRTPRSNLARLATDGRDPLGILNQQNETRVPELVPLRAERMSASAFAFYRGTAAIMAADLGRSPSSGIHVASCGDAHVANFGFFASPQRTLLFDLNDFDESAWAPWEWDVKRLVASIVVAGQATSRNPTIVQDAALAAVRAYARAITAATRKSPLQRYHEHFDANATISAMDPESRRVLRTAIRDAEKRTGERAVRRLTEADSGGRLRFIERPPTMTHVSLDLQERVHAFVAGYEASAGVDINMLLQHYTIADIARRVVGVGSVGTRCYLAVFQDGADNALLIQSKEAVPSVLIQYGGAEQPPELRAIIEAHGDGARVVALQRILQAMSDPFLGHLREPGSDFYVRQFHDMKGGIDMETLEDRPFSVYAQSCAATLARAHSQSATATAVAGYIGNGRIVGESILEWSMAYADLSRKDYEAFLAAEPAGAAVSV